jgi:AAA15 family ATPase/GTPase
MTQVTANSNRISILAQRLKKIESNALQLEGRRTVLIEQKASTILEIQSAQHYLDHKEEVLNFLNSLQESAQQATKKMYEELLTSLIKEVLPHKNDKIVFETSIKNGKMALEVNIMVKGKPLNVVKDKGGTIQNIVSMGLRFITVARSRNRKIILLDEADQWLKTKYIPRFSKIVKKLSEELNVQVIYISHHAPEAFSSHAKVITLVEKQGIVYCEDSAPPNIGEDDIGIRHIRLKNFKNHTDTLINLDKHVTVITGEGDVGKSSVIEAFSIIMNNDGRDAIVRDGIRCNIELAIEENKTIAYEYNLKREQKTYYALLGDGPVPIYESVDGRAKPVWLDTYLATPQVSGFDIHIGTQRNSNFILDHEKYSAQKRAEILSLDNEAEQIQKIIKLHSEKSSMYQKSITTLNKNLNKIKESLSKLNTLSAVFDIFESSNKLIDQIKINESNNDKIKENGTVIRKCAKKIEILKRIDEISSQTVEIDFGRTQILHSAIEEIKSLENIISTYSMIKKIHTAPVIELKPLGEIYRAGVILRSALNIVNALKPIEFVQESSKFELHRLASWSQITDLQSTATRVKALKMIENIQPIGDFNLADTTRINQFATQLNEASGLVSRLGSEITSSSQDLEQTKVDLTSLQNEMGKCPLCESSFHSHAH